MDWFLFISEGFSRLKEEEKHTTIILTLSIVNGSCYHNYSLSSWLSSTCCCCLVTQSCPALFDPMDCRLPDSSVHRDSPGKNTGMGCHALLQGIFPTLGLNLGLLCLPALAGKFFTTSTTWEPGFHFPVL